MPKKELIQTAESMEDDSVAEDERLEGKGKLPRTLDGCEREWNCVFWNDSQDIICTYAAKRKTSVWAGLGDICEKIRTLRVPRSFLLGLSALLGSTLRGAACLQRIWIQTLEQNILFWINSSVHSRGCRAGTLETGGYFATKSSQFLSTAVLHLLYTTLLKLPFIACVTVHDLIFFVFKSDGEIFSPARIFPVVTVQLLA